MLIKLLKQYQFVLLLSSFLLCFFSAAQEQPPIENFTPISYAAENQNWGISQSKEKNIYVANNGGLLEFNGAVWKLYGSPSGSAIRSVKAINDVVYTGCYMQFGFWKKNTLGDLEYSSISSSLELPLLEDEEFWNIVSVDDWVLFQSLERIYIYKTTDKSINVIDAKSTTAQLFNLDGSIYFHSTVDGLYKVENGKAVLVSDAAVIKNTVVTGFFSIHNKPVLLTEKGDFYLVENQNLVPWNTSFNEKTKAINVYSSLQLDDGSIVLGTISNGIYQLDQQGNITQHINQENGLNNNTVLSIFEDQENNLWLALDNGISIINVDSPFKEYLDKNGKLGVVYASAVHNNFLYLGTNQGLFYKRLDGDADFELIGGSQGQVWLLKIIDDVLFCGHNKGTYTVVGNQAQLVSDFPGTWDIKPIPGAENLMLQGNFNGLSVLEKRNNSWGLRNQIDGFDISSRFFEFVGNNEVVVNRESKGIFKLQLDAAYTKALQVNNEPSKGIGASFARYLDELVYTCSNGLYTYNDQQKQFVIDSVLTKAFFSTDNQPVGIFISDDNANRLWCFTNSSIRYAEPGKFDTSLEINDIAIPTYLRKNLGVLGFESLTPLSGDQYLIGISNGYLTVDLNKLVAKNYAVHINSITRNTTNYPPEKIAKDAKTNYEFDQNNLSFSYSVPEFDKFTEVNYQYQLKGRSNTWSEWTSISHASFENLPYGNYTLNVRAKIGNDLSTNTDSYEFRIERPWYLSNLAIILYCTSFVLLAVLVHKMYKRYYRKQREQLLLATKKKLKRKKLKAQKKIVQLNNEKLKEEVASKDRELAISTMSIIKKNEFLNAIKTQLSANAADPNIKSVIRTIDRNINNEDDWKFFEDAFNNADKDFLKKVKILHPELTANDLRLCAYLRLNLSSKEIAPLLNISVRSVEVKRYRLRKKMNLLHEDGLADYIMQV